MQPSCFERCGNSFISFRRQRVHVGAQADHARRMLDWPQRDDADDAGLRNAAMDLDAVFRQFGRNDVGRARLVERQFGVGVDVAADRGEGRRGTRGRNSLSLA